MIFQKTEYEPIKIDFGDEDKDGYFPYTNRAMWIQDKEWGDDIYYCSECHYMKVMPVIIDGECPFCHSKMTLSTDYVEPAECHNPDLETN